MKFRFAPCASVTAPTGVPPPAAQDLRVMTFDVRHPNPEDGATIWPNRRDMLVATVRAADPDMIGTQELFRSQARDVTQVLRGVSRLRSTRTDDAEIIIF